MGLLSNFETNFKHGENISNCKRPISIPTLRHPIIVSLHKWDSSKHVKVSTQLIIRVTRKGKKNNPTLSLFPNIQVFGTQARSKLFVLLISSKPTAFQAKKRSFPPRQLYHRLQSNGQISDEPFLISSKFWGWKTTVQNFAAIYMTTISCTTVGYWENVSIIRKIDKFVDKNMERLVYFQGTFCRIRESYKLRTTCSLSPTYK